MGKPNFRESSRTNWVQQAEQPTDEQIGVGALQRIADATEAMAKGHVRLQNDYDYMRGDRDRVRAENDRLTRSNAALRGYLKRLQRAEQPK